MAAVGLGCRALGSCGFGFGSGLGPVASTDRLLTRRSFGCDTAGDTAADFCAVMGGGGVSGCLGTASLLLFGLTVVAGGGVAGRGLGSVRGGAAIYLPMAIRWASALPTTLPVGDALLAESLPLRSNMDISEPVGAMDPESTGASLPPLSVLAAPALALRRKAGAAILGPGLTLRLAASVAAMKLGLLGSIALPPPPPGK